MHPGEQIKLSFKIEFDISVLGCADISGKELHRQVGVSIVVTLGHLHGIMVAYWPGMTEISV